MFWKRDPIELPGPRGIPDPVGRDIITKFGDNPDKVWNHFKAVIRPREGQKNTFDVRVYDEVQREARKVTVKDYNSLTEHPEMILYEGWYNKSWQADIRKKE